MKARARRTARAAHPAQTAKPASIASFFAPLRARQSVELQPSADGVPLTLHPDPALAGRTAPVLVPPVAPSAPEIVLVDSLEPVSDVQYEPSAPTGDLGQKIQDKIPAGQASLEVLPGEQDVRIVTSPDPDLVVVAPATPDGTPFRRSSRIAARPAAAPKAEPLDCESDSELHVSAASRRKQGP